MLLSLLFLEKTSATVTLVYLQKRQLSIALEEVRSRLTIAKSVLFSSLSASPLLLPVQHFSLLSTSLPLNALGTQRNCAVARTKRCPKGTPLASAFELCLRTTVGAALPRCRLCNFLYCVTSTPSPPLSSPSSALHWAIKTYLHKRRYTYETIKRYFSPSQNAWLT